RRPHPRGRLRLQGGAAVEPREARRADRRGPRRARHLATRRREQDADPPHDRRVLPDARAPASVEGTGGGGMRSVGIVGGGILGLTAAYRLASQGVHVALYERSNDLGGLVGSFDFDGRPVDRFYHVVLPTDDRVLGLAEELGLRDRFRFRPTAVGFYDSGRLFSMT